MSGKRATAGRTGVFIDFSNLFGAIGKKDSKTGEQVNYFVCYQKLREYLEGVHNSPVFYNLYACVDSNPKAEPYITRSKKHASFLNFLSGIGYNVIKKELKYLPNNTTKCDTD